MRLVVLRQRRGLLVCSTKNEMKTKEAFLKGKVFFEMFVALSCQAPLLYLQTLRFLFSCVISFDLPTVS